MARNPFEINRTARPTVSPAAQYGRMANRGQAGGISSISPQAKRDAFVNTQRGKFFDGRNVPEERVFRRTAQDILDKQFKDRFMRPAGGSNTNLLQMTADAPRSLAANRMLLANRLGPTPSEVFGDMTYAGGSILQNLAEKGTPVMNLAKSLYGGVQNFLSPMNPMPSINTGIENLQSGFNNFMQSGQDFNMVLAGLNPQQRRIYDLAITVPGTTREDALRQAKSFQRMAMGGISSLN